MRRRVIQPAVTSFAAVILFVCVTAGCRDQKRTQERDRAAEAGVEATVITIRTDLPHRNVTLRQTLAIAGDKARFLGEADAWRLIDLDDLTVTFVDDITRTTRTRSLQHMQGHRRAAIAAQLPPFIPRATFRKTGQTQRILGRLAAQYEVAAGAYRRELWFPTEQVFPASLFRLVHASEPLSAPYAGILRDVDPLLMRLDGYPLLEKSSVPFGNKTLTVAKNVEKVERRRLALATFRIPAGYEEIREPAAGRPSVSSPAPGRNARGAESRSSATARRTP